MKDENREQGVMRSIRNHLVASMGVGVLLVVAIGGWASMTRLSGAVVTSGHFVVDSYVKKVQHPTGGVVGEILVKEGQKVEAGQVVMRLDAASTRANLAIITRRLDEALGRYARLEAERDDSKTISFPRALLDRASDPQIAGIMHGETRLFEIRRQALDSKKAQLVERISQYEHEIEGLKAQETAYNSGIEVLDKEINSLVGLREQGIVSDQRLNGLKTQVATFGGDRGEKIAYQAQVAGRISETRLQIIQLDQDMKAEVGRDLRDTQAQIGEYSERKIAADDELRRIDIVAPQKGIVYQLAVHTVGGVIAPGDAVMLIVPEGDNLALDVKIQPKDVDQIAPGQPVVLRMSAFNQRTTPELSGFVNRVAPDLTVEERSGVSYYQVRISVPASETKKLGQLTLLPGMPAEAFIQTGERSALSYFMKPMTDQINRAFREE